MLQVHDEWPWCQYVMDTIYVDCGGIQQNVFQTFIIIIHVYLIAKICRKFNSLAAFLMADQGSAKNCGKIVWIGKPSGKFSFFFEKKFFHMSQPFSKPAGSADTVF